MSDAILTINAGSSSCKFEVFHVAGGVPEMTLRGQISGIGTNPVLTAKDDHGTFMAEQSYDAGTSQSALMRDLLAWIEDHLGGDHLVAAGHRVVHGGRRFFAPVKVDGAVLAELEALVPLAPLHQPHNLSAIRALAEAHPGLPQVACFDTAFHKDHDDAASRFALPRELHESGIRRYGFHGLSYAYVSRELARLAPEVASGKVVACHLGSGASLCAMENGVSVDSTMGFTALDGLPMGTRCGALDAGVVLHLMQAHGMDAKGLETLLYKKSGLLGVSGVSNDWRDLELSDKPEARQAMDLFVHRVVQNIGALAATLGGLDGLVFTAGIGERSARLRAEVCRRLSWMGVVLCPSANDRHGPCITRPHSRVPVWVIPTDEERMIALDTLAVLSPPATTKPSLELAS